MLQDFLDDGWILDETDSHAAVASRAGAGEWVHFVNLLDETGPVAAALFAEFAVFLGGDGCVVSRPQAAAPARFFCAWRTFE